MKVFVTGAAGFLGNNLVRLLIEQGYEVRGLVRSAARAANIFRGLPVELIEGDIRNVASYAPALDGCDLVFHTAAYFREYYQPGNHWEELYSINVRATIDLLREAERRGVKKVVHTSSSGVIGMKPGETWGDESCPPDHESLNNLYFRSKVVAEQEIAAFLPHSSLAVMMVLPGWMFGPGDTAPTSSGQLLLDLLNQKLPGQVNGGGVPVDVRDVAAGMIRAAEHGKSGERYIIGGDTLVPLTTLFKLTADLANVPLPRLFIPTSILFMYAWANELYSRLTGKPVLITVSGIKTLQHQRTFRSTKAIRELGVTFRPLHETLRDEIAWFRQERPEWLTTPAAQGGHVLPAR